MSQHQLVILGILRHWLKNQDAKDVCDGIGQYWLHGNLVDLGREKVQQALDDLVTRGWITERLSKSAKTIYGLNTKKLVEIEDFVREEDERDQDNK